MPRPCRYCGAFFQEDQDLNEHEDIHRNLSILSQMSWKNDSMETDLHDVMNEQVSGNNDSSKGSSFIGHRCTLCQKIFTQRRNLLAHVRAKHERQTTHSCSKCKKVFKCKRRKTQHEKNCNGETNHLCPRCNKWCFSYQGLLQHLKWHEKTPSSMNSKSKGYKPHSISRPDPQSVNTMPTCGDPPQRLQVRCRRCTEVFDNRRALYLHGMREHYNQYGGALQHRPWDEDVGGPWNGDDALQEAYDVNAPLILEPHRHGPIHSVYNFPVANEVNMNQLMQFAENVYRRVQRAFRLNIVFGVILQNRESERYRYFVPYTNSGVFDIPVYVSRRTDLQRLRRELERKDILTELLRQRPDTKWIPVLVTNVHFVVSETYYPLGQGQLPDFLLKKDSLYPLVKNRHNGKLYTDNLCAFRCLALHRGYEIRSIDGPAKELYQQWCDQSPDKFEGLSVDEFPEFENKFKINLEVYNLTKDGFAYSIYKSRGQHETSMYVNLFNNHLSYIRDFSLYAQKYQCKTCDRHFNKSGNLHRHQKVCSNKTKFVYPGGFHRNRESIFDQLDQYDIHVPEVDRVFEWYICYDLESMLQKVDDQPTECLHWTAKHVPVSVSICSNVEGYTDSVCIIDADQNQLVKKMVSQMTQIADRVYELSKEKWGWILEAINNKIRESEDLHVQIEWEHDSSGDEIEDEARKDDSETKRPLHPLQKIYGHMETYMSQVPVLGFNSAKYDLNLIKRSLAKCLNMHNQSDAFVVKNNNAYMCIATESLKFLDMSQFLAAGTSYSGFLKAYYVEEKKGFFPYEWFDNAAKLEVTCLPDHKEFYSNLKGCNISTEDYKVCQKAWSDNKMSTFRDFLVWYNNLDVGPFITAVERFQSFYFHKGIDVFKTSISVPGLARQLLFSSAQKQQANFALFDKRNSDLYQTIKQNIIGGPSIIFTRHHCAGQTFIRGQKPCGSIVGYDANALYLQAIGQPMPIGSFVRRLHENEFRPELRDKYMAAFYWLDWITHTEGFKIQHKLNTGREVMIGKYPVDGFKHPTHPNEKGTVFQFHGCYWHGHLCEITKGITDEKWRASRQTRYDRTQKTSAFLKKDHQVIEMWECHFRRYCRENPAIYDFIDAMRPGFFQKHKGKISEDAILEGVVKGKLFGMVEVDIQVPEQWPSYCQHSSLTPYQYFQEMSPLFCTTEIPFDAIGHHMQKHIEDNNLSKTPRRLLVGGMKGKQMLIATPLLRWYLKHGMVVTKIYQVVEFQQQRCFQEFVKEVSDARRQGDANPDTAIIAETMKVIGNSGYGSLIMDKTKHRNIQYIQGENQTSLKINDPLFRKLDCLDAEEQYYEVEMGKGRIKLDLPIQLGYFILQYAKLRMLEFYYDFMDVYVERTEFEMAETDTDSAYMAISGSSLEEVIKPEMLYKYKHGLTGFCSDSEIEADDDLHWFPRTCCSKHANYDKRTPGLFKLEYQGDEMIGLCSKTYIVRKARVIKMSLVRVAAYHLLRKSLKLKRKRCPYKSRITNEFKFSSKGVSKRQLKAPMAKYRNVIKKHKSESGINHGFRVRDNAIFTYTQERRGFSYLYCKRKVLEDGIHTEPLDITLCPIPPQEPEVDDQELVDLLASNFEDETL